MPFRFYSLCICLGCILQCSQLYATKLEGTVKNTHGNVIKFAKVQIQSKNENRTSLTNKNGRFQFKGLIDSIYQIEISKNGYSTIIDSLVIKNSLNEEYNFVLKFDSYNTSEVLVEESTYIKTIKESAFDVNVIESKSIENRSIDVNPLLSRTAGVRVRESGGLGSDFTYSLNGMSGRAIRFFVDGVPIDRYGAGYGINNFPVNLIESIEVYKGVVPPMFAADAMGGVVNLTTKQGYSSFLDASYSLGSFGTHRTALAARWANQNSGLYVLAQGFYNSSNNNYEVWGKGVEIADPLTGRAVEIRTERFHNAFQSMSSKIEVGIQDQVWTDKLSFSFLSSDLENEIQHGATMAKVFGEVLRTESSWSPTLQFKKNNAIFEGLDVSVYSSYTQFDNTLRDTSSRIYDWSGKVIDEGEKYSEFGFGNNGKSLLTLQSENLFSQSILNYEVNENQKLFFSYSNDYTKRQGFDVFEGDRTAGFRSPQSIAKHITSLAFEQKLFDKQNTTIVWAKNYNFSANSVDEIYITDNKGYRPIEIPISGEFSDLGFGIASKYEIQKGSIVKLSIERAFRLPDVDEMLGDGLLVKNNANLLPEESLNLNVAVLNSDIEISDEISLSSEVSYFYRDVKNLILMIIQENRGVGLHENIGEVVVNGVSSELQLRYKNILEVKVNATFQDLRDNRQFIGPNVNETFRDRLRNTPYLLANSGVYYNLKQILPNENLTLFWDIQYVHQFYLNWPSLGRSSTKAIIPTQLLNNIGLTFSFDNNRYNLNVECNNIFDNQVYDNYLLQKPGRAYSAKFRYSIL